MGEMCPDIKKWLLGGSLENNCAYTSSGCPRCFGKTHRCSFDYKKKGCDKKTITNKKDAVQGLVDMKLISKEEKNKNRRKKVLRTIKNLENPLHCCEKKRRNPVTKTVTKIKKSTNDPQDETPREKEETKKTKLITKKTKQEPTPKDKKKREIEKTTIFNKQDAEKKKKIKAYQDKKKEDRDRKEQGEKEKQQNRKRESEKRNLDFQKRMKIKEEKKKEKEDGDQRKKEKADKEKI